jgi:RHS repeat-associated protein
MLETATGNYNFRFRDYSLATARPIQPDPLGYPDGTNRYEWERGSPVHGLDPVGLKITVLPDHKLPEDVDILDFQGDWGKTAWVPGEEPKAKVLSHEEAVGTTCPSDCPGGYAYTATVTDTIEFEAQLRVMYIRMVISPESLLKLAGRGIDVRMMQSRVDAWNASTLAHEHKHVDDTLRIWGAPLVAVGTATACSREDAIKAARAAAVQDYLRQRAERVAADINAVNELHDQTHLNEVMNYLRLQRDAASPLLRDIEPPPPPFYMYWPEHEG